MLRLVHSAAVVLLVTVTAFAQPGVSYPKVYGPTGSLYGPTQAHYQYLKQNGRTWVSPGGASLSPQEAAALANGQATGSAYTVGPYLGHYQVPGYHHYGNAHYGNGYYGNAYAANALASSYLLGLSAGHGYGQGYGSGHGYGYPYGHNLGYGSPYNHGYGNYGYGNYGYGVGYPPTYNNGYESVAPVVRQAHPLWIGQNPFDNEVLARSQLEEQLRWKSPLAIEPVTPSRRPRLAVEQSSPEMIRRSLEHRTNGDSWFRKQRYSTAYGRYRNAITAARDVPEAYLHAGFALAAMNRPEQAAEFFRDAVDLAPELPQTGTPLRELFGEENDLSRTSVILQTSDWVREDIRDPERLYVLGVLLHFDGQEDKAAEFFETAFRLAGGGEHLAAFLRLPNAAEVDAAPGQRAQPLPAEAAPPAEPAPPANGDLIPREVPRADPVPAERAPRADPGPELPFPS